jgi:NADPH-dependent 2,4-dienoyl-CoA reductase/sulfur reductase-like enzyme
MAFHPTKNPKKVMVIGGGPGGLNVAWVAAWRGHDVHLFEKQSTLGGQLLLGTVSDYKKELRSLIRFQKRQIKKFGVKCHLNQEVTVETVRQENPDVVIAATGSLPSLPPIKGIKKDIVIPYADVLTEATTVPKKRTVVIGGGPTGCEVALHLSQHGSPVTIVEMLPKIGKPLESITRKVLLKELRSNHVESMTQCKLSRIADNGVFVCGEDGSEQFIEAERVIITIGNRPDKELYDQITPLGYEVHQIGDCLEPRSAKAAIYEGAVLGRAI